MRILIVNPALPPYTLGGSDLYAYDLATELAREHTVHLFSRIPASASIPEGGKLGGIPWSGVSTGLKGPDAVRTLEEAFDALLDSFAPDVVHLHHLRNLSFRLIGLAKRRGVPTVLTLHDFWLMCQRYFLVRNTWQPCSGPGLFKCWHCLSRIPHYVPRPPGVGGRVGFDLRAVAASSLPRLLRHRSIAARLLRDVDLVISPSRHLLDRFVGEFPFLADKIVHCSHGVDPTPFQHGIGHALGPRLQVGYVGTLDFYKGTHVLLDAFQGLSEADLLLYGLVKPRFAPYLENRIGPNIHLKGTLEPSRRSTIYSEVDLLVLPSVCRENLPVTILEAFAALVPVIASDIAGMAELVKDGESGFLFRVGDAGHLRELLRTMIAQPELLDHFRARIPSVKTLRENATEMISLYWRVCHEACGFCRHS